METNPVSIWLVVGVLMLGPVLLLAAAAVVFVWVGFWRSRAEKVGPKSLELQGQAQELLSQLGELRGEYAAVGRAVYTRMAEELDPPIAEVISRTDALPGLLSELERIGQTPPAGEGVNVTGFWRTAGERRRLWIDFERNQKALLLEMEQARLMIRQLENRPFETYQRVQSAREQIDQLEAILSELRGWGLEGLEEASAALSQARHTSLMIPVGFTGSGPLPRATLFEMTAIVVEVLDVLEPLLDRWLNEAVSWSEQVQSGMDTYQRLLTNLANLRAVTSAAPPILLDISSFLILLGQLEERVRAQFEMFQSSGVQDLARHVHAAQRFENTLRNSSAEHDRACLEAMELERKLLELESKYASLETAVMENRDADIAFERDQSRIRLAGIDARMDGLRPFNAKLLPGIISERISLANELLGELQGLDRDVREHLQRFEELLKLLRSSDFQTGSAWINAVRLDIRAAQDASEATRDKGWNWRAKTDALLRSLDGLEALQSRLVPALLPNSYRESELDECLEQVHRLAELHAQIRPQVEQVLSGRNNPGS